MDYKLFKKVSQEAMSVNSALNTVQDKKLYTDNGTF